MELKEKQKKVLHSEWTITEPVKLDDIFILESTGQEYLCSKIIPYEQFEYLYFGSFDFNEILFAVQYKLDDKNYVKVLTEESQKKSVFNIYKSWAENECRKS